MLSNFLASIMFKARELRNEAGQTLVEYGLIVALIAVVAIVALALVGTEVRDVFQSVADRLGDGAAETSE